MFAIRHIPTEKFLRIGIGSGGLDYEDGPEIYASHLYDGIIFVTDTYVECEELISRESSLAKFDPDKPRIDPKDYKIVRLIYQDDDYLS